MIITFMRMHIADDIFGKCGTVPPKYGQFAYVRILAGQSRIFQIYHQQCPARTPKRVKSFFYAIRSYKCMCPAKFEALSSYSFDRGWHV